MALLLSLLLVVTVAGLAWRYGPLLAEVRHFRDSAQQFAAEARALDPAAIDRATLDRLQAQLRDLDITLRPIYSAVHEDPLVRLAASVPGVSPQLQGVTSLADAADALIQAGDVGLDLAAELVTLQEMDAADPSFALMPELLRLMTASEADVDRIADLLASATTSIDAVPTEAIGQILEARDVVAEPLRDFAPLVEQYRAAADVVPRLLGWRDERRYLVLAQNPSELRPQGGYSGTVGVIAIRDGQISQQRFVDVHALDGKAGLPFIEPPPELANYLLGDDQSWRLADAAWSPDYPTAAAKALEFYELETGDGDIDGVIAVTTYALDRILEVLGPVTLDEYDTTVKAGDSTLVLLGETRGPSDGQASATRKEILDALARVMTQRLLALPPDQMFDMADAVGDMAAQKMALAWFVDEDIQRLLDDSGWNGSVRQDSGDYLYVVEANMAPTSKYNLIVDRSDSLVVKLSPSGDALNSVRLDWQNDAGKTGEPYRSLRGFSSDQEGGYGAYVKVMVPRESQLLTASGRAAEDIRGVEAVSEDAGRATFANYLFMPPGEATLTYLWMTPAVATPTEDAWEYSLVVQKQPGARSHPLDIRIDLPDGATVIEAPEGASIDGERVRISTDLSEDFTLLVRYSLGESPG